MLATKWGPLILPAIVEAIRSNAENDSSATQRREHHDGVRTQGQTFIDDILTEWLRNPDQIEDEGVETPSRTIIRLAIDLAESFRDNGLAPPDSVVPDGSGGIVFERREGDVCEVFHIWDDGTVDYQCFDGTRLVERKSL